MDDIFHVMVTGHRSGKIGGFDKENPVRQFIRKYIKDILLEIQKSHPNICGISGMAIGVDQDFCEVCLDLNIPYKAYVPFMGQESIWPQRAKEEYGVLLAKASGVIVASEGSYSPKKMQIRNCRMVDDADFGIGVWDGSTGGTYNCIQYLKKENIPLVIINPSAYKEESGHIYSLKK